MSTKKRAGKLLTVIKGLEKYALSVQVVAEDLKRFCYASTTVQQATGTKATDGLSELLVQGDQTAKVTQYLIQKGLIKSMIEIS